ncbi:MAG: hypothetical protein GOU99_02905, partial [Candidatus Altiarchaeota archaeon]|nr:hypothetical protein [Candidatus Altiarchaeota archaeon]
WDKPGYATVMVDQIITAISTNQSASFSLPSGDYDLIVMLTTESGYSWFGSTEISVSYLSGLSTLNTIFALIVLGFIGIKLVIKKWKP